MNSSEDRGQVKAPTKWSLRTWEFSISCSFCFSPCCFSPRSTISVRRSICESIVSLMLIRSDRRQSKKATEEESYDWRNSFLSLYSSIIYIIRAYSLLLGTMQKISETYIYAGIWFCTAVMHNCYMSLCGLVKPMVYLAFFCIVVSTKCSTEEKEKKEVLHLARWKHVWMNETKVLTFLSRLLFFRPRSHVILWLFA